MKTFKLLGADGKTYESKTKAKYGGVRNRKVYGEPRGAQSHREGRAVQEARVFFADEATAIAAVYRPCGTCMREKYKVWKDAKPEKKPAT